MKETLAFSSKEEPPVHYRRSSLSSRVFSIVFHFVRSVSPGRLF